MAFSDPYATVEELEARLGREEDGTFEGLLLAASRAVEAFCGRNFNKDTAMSPTATERQFVAADPERLPVDDFHTLTDLAVEVSGVARDVSTFAARPYGGVRNGVPGWPYYDLIAVGRRWPATRRAVVAVTAHWGWAAVPEAVKQATLNVASTSFYGTGGEWPKRQETLSDYSVSYAVPGTDSFAGADVPRDLVGVVAYRRRRFGVA